MSPSDLKPLNKYIFGSLPEEKKNLHNVLKYRFIGKVQLLYTPIKSHAFDKYLRCNYQEALKVGWFHRHAHKTDEAASQWPSPKDTQQNQPRQIPKSFYRIWKFKINFTNAERAAWLRIFFTWDVLDEDAADNWLCHGDRKEFGEAANLNLKTKSVWIQNTWRNESYCDTADGFRAIIVTSQFESQEL